MMTKRLGAAMICALVATSLTANVYASDYSGKIFLQVEDHGEAWYVNPATDTRYYLQTGEHAYEALRLFGLGISNEDIAKIPVGVSPAMPVWLDTDEDGLSDPMETALGTDVNDVDSDDDGHDDLVEYQNGTSPLGSGSVVVDTALVNRLKGYILLQVNAHGEAWYVNPADGKRYYMYDGDAAYDLMRYMGIGITNADLSAIAIDPASPFPPTGPWKTYTYSTDDFFLTIDFPSNSFVQDLSDTENPAVTATILDGESALTVMWAEGSKEPGYFLPGIDEERKCEPMTYGLYDGIECLDVSVQGMNAFIFEARGYTFIINDDNFEGSNAFYGYDWSHVNSSVTVLPPPLFD